MPIVPNANHLTRSFVLSLVSRSFCSRERRYSISLTTSATISSIRRSSVSTGLSFSWAWMLDQSRASAPMSTSSSMERKGFATASVHKLVRVIVDNRGREEGRTVRNKLVLETHIKGRIRGRSKRLTSLAGDILRTTVVVSKGIFDL